jgi:cell division protein FtsI (penicillin-binding protein 3)
MPDLLRDHAVSDVYEPGSTFKLVTYSAAMDSKVATPDDMIDCQGGKITIAGRTIHDNQGEHYGVIPLHQALEVSSDVAAVKLALKVGPDRFYQYMHDFGFGTRLSVELPGETRGLLRPVNRWGSSSIASLAIGQEVAVTPLQLVTMVSTIANGGVYLPPHVLMPEQSAPATTPVQKSAPPQVAQAAQSHATQLPTDLPNPLPLGAHRVISTLAAAEMRKMMEGVVLFGTGKQAQLNGYSSGGKTGTAQKIDPVTHTYSKTMHIASFASFAPVNNPVIAVAVVIDSPKGAYYGAEVSAPVFAEVAQQALEYLGVQHDIDLRPAATASKKTRPVREDDSSAQGEDIQALYDAANDLPNDDSLRTAPAPSASASSPAATPSVQAANTAAGSNPGASPAHVSTTPAQQTKSNPPPAANSVVIAAAGQLLVPSLIGLPVRKVIEQAGAAGLEVVIDGNGTAREQAPAPGAMVPPGTKIVVRCVR